MRRSSTLSIVAVLVLSASAWAGDGFHYKAETVTTGTNMKQPDTMVIESWVEGPNARIQFLEVGESNPFLGEGKYVLTNDGGETLYLVDPKENTHAKFDLSQIVGFAAAFMDSGMFNMEVSNYAVEELESHDGPPIHGYDTEYHKYRTSYDLLMKIMGMKRADHYVMDHEIWSVEDLEASGFQAWMRPRETGFEAVDTLLKGELEKVHGFPFKSVTTTRTEGAKRKNRTMTTTSTTEVTEFEAVNVSDSMFELSPDSQEIALVGVGTIEGQEPEEEPREEKKGGFMKRLKRMGKDDG